MVRRSLVGGELTYGLDHLVDSGNDDVLERVRERQRHAGRGDAADRRIERLEPLVGDDRGDGTSPSALVRVLLDDDEPRRALNRLQNRADVERDETAQVEDL